MPFPALFAVGLGIQVYSALRSSQLQASQMRRAATNARLSGQINLEQAKFQAEMFMKSGKEQAEAIRRDSARNIGQLVANVGVSGLELRGSILEAISDQIRLDENAAATTMVNAAAGASTVRQRGEGANAEARANASFLRSQASITETTGWLNAISIGIGGAADHFANTGGPRTTDTQITGAGGGRTRSTITKLTSSAAITIPSTTRFGGPR